MSTAAGASFHVWVKDAARKDNPQYTKIAFGSELVDVSDLKTAVLAEFRSRWGEHAKDDVTLFLVSLEPGKTKPNPSEELCAQGMAPLDSTDSLKDANVKSGCFLLAKCAGVGVASELFVERASLRTTVLFPFHCLVLSASNLFA